MQNPDPEHLERGDGRAVDRLLADGIIELGPETTLAVDAADLSGRTLTVVVQGRRVELQVREGETDEQVARRLADAINGVA